MNLIEYNVEYLALAGYNVSESMSALPLILQSAQAGAMDLGTASDLATDVLGSLGENSEFTGDKIKDLDILLNQVAHTSTVSNTSMEQLLNSYIKVGGQVENMNIPLSTANTMLGILADRGLKAEESGNSLNSILINLTKSGGESADALKKLGVSAFDTNGEIKPIEQTLGELKSKLEGLTSDKERVQLINMIGGKTQAKTLQKLLQGIDAETKTFTDHYKQLKEEIEDSPNFDALKDLSDKMTDNLSGDFKILKSTIQEGFLQVFDSIEPQLRKFTQSLTEVVKRVTEAFTRMSPAMQKLAIGFTLIVGVASPLLAIFGAMSVGIGALISTSGKLIGAIGNVVTKGKLLLTGGLKITNLFKMFNLKAMAIVGTLGLVAVAVSKVFAEMTSASIEGASAITEGMSSVTKNLVDPFVESEQAIGTSMLKLKANAGAVTEEMALEVTNNVEEMTNQTVGLLEGQKINAEKVLTSTFNGMSSISKEESKLVVDGVKKAFDEKIATIQESEMIITEILERAKNEKRDLNAQELADVQQHQESIKQAGLLAMSSYSSEMETIQQRLKERQSELNAESVADAIKGAKEKRDKVKEEATQEVNELQIIYDNYGKNLGVKEKRLLQKALENAKTKKEQVTQIADQEYAELLRLAQKSAGDQVNNIDWATGEIKSKWTAMWDNMKVNTGDFGLDALGTLFTDIGLSMETLGLKAQRAGLHIQKFFTFDKGKDAELDEQIAKLDKQIEEHENYAKRVKEIYASLPKDVRSVMRDFDSVFSEAFGMSTRQFFGQSKEEIGKLIGDYNKLSPEVQNALRNMNDALITEGKIGGLKDLVSYTTGELDVLRMLYTDLPEPIRESITAINNQLSDLGQDIDLGDFVETCRVNTEEATKQFEKLPEGVRTILSSFTQDDWKTIFAYYDPAIDESINSAIETVNNKNEEVKNAGKENGKNLVEGQKEGIIEGTPDVDVALQGLKDATEKGLEGTKEKGKKGGKDLSDGVAEGVNSSKGQVDMSVQGIADALGIVDNIHLGGVTKQLSEVSRWLGVVVTDSNTTKGALTTITTVSFGGVTKGLSEVDKWLKTCERASSWTKKGLANITTVTFGAVTKGLSEVDKWLKTCERASKNTRNGIKGIGDIRFGGLISSLNSVKSALQGVVDKANSTKKAVASVQSARPRSIEMPNVEEMNRSAMSTYSSIFDYADGVNIAKFKTSGGFYNARPIVAPAPVTQGSEIVELKSVLKATLEQNQILMQLLGQTKPIEVAVNLDGRQMVKASAKYMGTEMNTLSNRKNRLGGKF